MAAQESRTASLPANADAYQLALPEGFKLPDGVALELNANDPNFKAAQAMAHAKGWTQADFSDALGVVAMMEANKAAAFETAKSAELGTLGANADKRIAAIVPWIVAEAGEKDAKPIIATLATAAHVRFFEKILAKQTSQGAASFTQQHRVAPDDKSIPGYEGMSFEQRRFAQDQRARKTG
jgi:hypothetical protein